MCVCMYVCIYIYIYSYIYIFIWRDISLSVRILVGGIRINGLTLNPNPSGEPGSPDAPTPLKRSMLPPALR